MNKILVIEDDLGQFNEIKRGLEPVYQVIPKTNFQVELFDNLSNLNKEISKLLDKYKRELVGIILDANLKDHCGIGINNMSGIEDILPAIRNKNDLFSIIPIIILTKYPELKKEALNNLGNYFVEKKTDLEKQVKTEIRWILSSLATIYKITKKRLECINVFIVQEMFESFKNNVEILLQWTDNINEIVSEFLPKIYERVEGVDKKMEIAVYSILSLMPEKKTEIVNKTLEEIQTTTIADIKTRLKKLEDQNKWESFKKKLSELTLNEIPSALAAEFGINALKLLVRCAIELFKS